MGMRRGGERRGGETEPVGRGRVCNTIIISETDSNTETNEAIAFNAKELLLMLFPLLFKYIIFSTII
jgi:hypothetical protein